MSVGGMVKTDLAGGGSPGLQRAQRCEGWGYRLDRRNGCLDQGAGKTAPSSGSGTISRAAG